MLFPEELGGGAGLDQSTCFEILRELMKKYLKLRSVLAAKCWFHKCLFILVSIVFNPVGALAAGILENCRACRGNHGGLFKSHAEDLLSAVV